jgi:dihydroxy-acid dehydratase
MDAKTRIKSRLPSRHVTEHPERALENASPAVVAAPGGSTNVALHLPAIAHQCSTRFDPFDSAEIFKKTPYVADLKPGGRYVAKDMFEVGGIPLLMKTLLDNGYLHGDCLTVTGRTIAENLKSVKCNPHQDVVRAADEPITVTGGVVGLKGNLAPEGAIAKVAGVSNLKFIGPVRDFDCAEDAFESAQKKAYQGEVIATHGRCSGPVGPEAAIGGPIALLQDGDLIGIVNVKLTDAEMAERKTKWKPRATNHTSGALWKYAQQVGPAVDGAVTHPGGAHEKQCYADI